MTNTIPPRPLSPVSARLRTRYPEAHPSNPFLKHLYNAQKKNQPYADLSQGSALSKQHQQSQTGRMPFQSQIRELVEVNPNREGDIGMVMGSKNRPAGICKINRYRTGTKANIRDIKSLERYLQEQTPIEGSALNVPEIWRERGFPDESLIPKSDRDPEKQRERLDNFMENGAGTGQGLMKKDLALIFKYSPTAFSGAVNGSHGVPFPIDDFIIKEFPESYYAERWQDPLIPPQQAIDDTRAKGWPVPEFALTPEEKENRRIEREKEINRIRNNEIRSKMKMSNFLDPVPNVANLPNSSPNEPEG